MYAIQYSKFDADVKHFQFRRVLLFSRFLLYLYGLSISVVIMYGMIISNRQHRTIENTFLIVFVFAVFVFQALSRISRTNHQNIRLLMLLLVYKERMTAE
jgi:hypothetical protein